MAARIRSDLSRRGILAAGLAASVFSPARAAVPLTVFAAASLKPALDEIAEGWDVALSYGASGALARQVAAGAPADVVILAATDWMEWLGARGVLARPARSLAQNRLVLAGAPGVETVSLTVAGVARALDGGRLAMGDPMSVPAGRYAVQALRSSGLWSSLSGRLILTQDVRAALAYVARGDVALGAVYRSDATGAGVSVAATFPASSHDPIVYPGACASDRPEARAFLDHVAASDRIFAAWGFGG